MADAVISPRQLAATIVVCASDALETWRASWSASLGRYLICDGTADDVEIQAAIDALPSAGGVIHLTEGHYSISGTITLKNSVVIQGAGNIWATTISLANGSNINMFEGNFIGNAGSSLRHMTINGNAANQASGWLVYLTAGYDHLFERVFFTSGKDGGLYLGASVWAPRIINSVIEYNTGPGFVFVGTGLRMDDCYAADNSGDGFVFGDAVPTAASGTVANTISYHNGDAGFSVVAGLINFVNNMADSNTGHGFEVVSDAGQRTTLVGCSAQLNNRGFWIASTRVNLIGAIAVGNTTGLWLSSGGIGIIANNQIYSNTTNFVLGPVATGYIFSKNSGFIRPAEIRSDSGSLTAGVANAIAFAWHNPEEQDILIKKVVIEVTTGGGTAGSHLDVGIADDAAGTNRGTEFFNDLLLNDVDINDSWVAGDGGTQTKWVFCQDSASATDGWIVGQILDANAANLVGKYYVEYVGR